MAVFRDMSSYTRIVAWATVRVDYTDNVGVSVRVNTSSEKARTQEIKEQRQHKLRRLCKNPDEGTNDD